MRISKRQLESIRSKRYNNLKKMCSSWSGQVICFGSTWESDLKTIVSEHLFSPNNLYFIFPHNLSDESVRSHFLYLPKNSKKVENIESFDFVSSVSDRCFVFVITEMGVLCDLYPYFDQVYIGGGFGKSIHSVLEPHVSGAKVFCGPKVYRSSEYEYIKAKSPESIAKIENMSEMEIYNSKNPCIRGD